MDCKFGLSVFLVLLVCWEAQAAVNCAVTGAGRHPDPNDTTCQNYTLCIYNSSNRTFLSYNYVCPTTSVFNPSIAQCTASSNYVCNVTSTNSTTSLCTAEGFFADPRSTNCSSYIQCININGVYIETTYTCPSRTYYNPNSTLCETSYTCTSRFRCSTAGRFADTNDNTCKRYYFCVLSTNQTFLRYDYTCPSTSVFDPNTRACTTSYACIFLGK